jgi:hypothetical protein
MSWKFEPTWQADLDVYGTTGNPNRDFNSIIKAQITKQINENWSISFYGIEH